MSEINITQEQLPDLSNLNKVQIDQIVDKKLAFLEAEYELVKKYDDPNYNKVDLKGETIEQLKQQQPEIQQEETSKKEKVQVDNQEEQQEDEEQEYQYQCLDEQNQEEPDEEQWGEMQQADINFDAIEHKNPFDQPLQVDLIKSIMANIQLPVPQWASNKDEWAAKLDKLLKE